MACILKRILPNKVILVNTNRYEYLEKISMTKRKIGAKVEILVTLIVIKVLNNLSGMWTTIDMI